MAVKLDLAARADCSFALERNFRFIKMLPLDRSVTLALISTRCIYKLSLFSSFFLPLFLVQVELLCPLNAVDPINYVQKRMQQDEAADSWQPEGQLWNTIGLEPIDQEFLQSHQIQIENKFVAIEWILKCECSKNVSIGAVGTGGAGGA